MDSDPIQTTAPQPCGKASCGVTRACCRADCPILMSAQEGAWEWVRKDGLVLMRGATEAEFQAIKDSIISADVERIVASAKNHG